MNLKPKIKNDLETRYGSNPNWKYLNASKKFGNVETGNNLVLTKLTTDIRDSFLDNLKENETLYVFVNRKKILMQKIYYQLAQELKAYTNIKIMYLEDFKSGIFTNITVKNFLEPTKVLVLLTKNYNKKELNLLKELKKTNTTPLVISLNTHYYDKKSFSVNIYGIKAYYWFLYAIALAKIPITYNTFSKDYVFTDKELDFEPLNSTTS